MRSLLSAVLLSFLAICPLKSLDHGFDSCLSTDLTNPLHKTKLDAGSCFMIPKGASYCVLSPRIATYFDQNFDLNFGVGFRKPFIQKSGLLGCHVFYDFSIQKPRALHQAGFCVEMLSDFFDARANYYHPIKNASILFESKPQKWVEFEGMWKFTCFSFALVPSYNFTSSHFSVKPKVILPFSVFTLEAGVNLSENFTETASYISVGIPLYNAGCRPVSRASSVRHYVRPCSEIAQKKKLSLRS